MALVWQKQTKDTLYEVRSAGQSLRLYTNKVFHTQYNPRNPLTGHIWDLLMLPAFFYQPGEIKRVLVMGVGGGAVIHLLKHFVKAEKIIGIELNPVHIQIAKKFFKLDSKQVTLVKADAVNWLKNYRGEKFDLIIDDLFAEQDGEPLPVVNANRGWFESMLKHLSQQGIIVRNFIDKKELQQSAGLKNKFIASKFESVFQLVSIMDENFVGVYLRKKASSKMLRKRLVATPGLNPDLKTSRLRYKIRRLK